MANQNSWRRNLRPASFRNLSFFIDISSLTTGRKIVLHEYPDRALGFPEDLGKIPRSFKLDCHIIGDDYFEQKRLLIEAFERQGTGELVHPYYGTLIVQTGTVTVNEDTAQGRIAAFSVQCYEAGDNTFPNNIQDKAAVLRDRTATLQQVAKQEFDENFSIVSLPGFAVDSARAKINEVSLLFDQSTQGFVTLSEEASRLAFGTRNLIAETDDLLQGPEVLSDRLLGSFSLLNDTLVSVRDRFTAARAFTRVGSNDEPIPDTTETRRAEARNNQVFNTFITQVAISNLASSAIEIDYDNIEEANRARQEISALIATQLESTQNDDIYQALLDLNAVVVRSLPDVDADLPNIESFTTNQATNSLIVVYNLFENLDSEQDLIRRNNIKNPAVISDCTELEVLDVNR